LSGGSKNRSHLDHGHSSVTERDRIGLASSLSVSGCTHAHTHALLGRGGDTGWSKTPPTLRNGEEGTLPYTWFLETLEVGFWDCQATNIHLFPGRVRRHLLGAVSSVLPIAGIKWEAGHLPAGWPGPFLWPHHL
jgi:hypothetical protein